jgi:hypothetical protein
LFIAKIKSLGSTNKGFEMSSVDQFVRTSILTFPSFATSRTAVLHHALCVLGSGYAWSEDGTVVSTTDEPFNLWTKAKAIEQMETYLEDNLPPEMREFVRPAFEKNLVEEAKVVAEVETRVHLWAQVEHFYPQTPYALLMNMPANVTPDWEAACAEMCELAAEAGWKF